MKNIFNRGNKVITFSYILGMLGMISILIAIFISREEPKQNIHEETYKDTTAFWTLDREGTQPVNVKKLLFSTLNDVPFITLNGAVSA